MHFTVIIFSITNRISSNPTRGNNCCFNAFLTPAEHQGLQFWWPSSCHGESNLVQFSDLHLLMFSGCCFFFFFFFALCACRCIITISAFELPFNTSQLNIQSAFVFQHWLTVSCVTLMFYVAGGVNNTFRGFEAWIDVILALSFLTKTVLYLILFLCRIWQPCVFIWLMKAKWAQVENFDLNLWHKFIMNLFYLAFFLTEKKQGLSC